MPELSIVKNSAIKLLEFSSKWLFRLALALLIVLALYISLSRYYLPRLNSYKPDIESSLSFFYNTPVSIEDLSGKLRGITPVIDIRGVLFGDAATPLLQVEAIKVSPNISSSLKNTTLHLNLLEINNAKASLYENKDHKWSFLQAQKKQTALDVDSIIDSVLSFGRLSFSDIEVEFNYLDGSKLKTPKLDGLLERAGSFRRFQLLTDSELDEQGFVKKNLEPQLYFSFEGEGDPRRKNFDGRWVFKSQDNSSLDFLSALLVEKQQQLKLQLGNTHLYGFVGVDNKLHSQGEINAERFELLEKSKTVFDLDKLHLQLRWERDAAANLKQNQFWLQQMKLRHKGIDSQLFSQAYISHNANDYGHQLKVHLDSSRIRPLSNALAAYKKLDDFVLRTLENINMSGELKDTQAFVQIHNGVTNKTVQANSEPNADNLSSQKVTSKTGPNKITWEFSSTLKDVNSKPYRGIPGLGNGNMYLWANNNHGVADIDTDAWTQIHFDQIYSQPLRFNNLNTKVHWDIAQTGFYLYSQEISAQMNGGQASGFFSLDTSKDKARKPVLALSLGLENAPLTVQKYLVPKTLEDGLLKWLKQSQINGSASTANFLFHGEVGHKDKKVSHQERIIQLDIDYSNTRLTFHEDWPQVTAAKGNVFLNNNVTTVRVDDGRLLNTRIKDSDIIIAPAKQGRKGTILTATGLLEGQAGDVVYVLNNTNLPTKDGVFKNWQAKGSLTASLDLSLPLKKGLGEPNVDIQANLKNVNVDMQDQKISLQNVSGPFAYSTEKGVVSNGLKANFLGKPTQANIRSDYCIPNKKSLCISVDAKGSVSAQGIRELTGQKLFAQLSGQTNYQANIRIQPEQGVTIKVNSQLQGINIDLPSPFFKSSSEIMPTTYVQTIGNKSQSLNLSLGNSIQFSSNTNELGKSGQRLSFASGAANNKNIQSGVFAVDGYLTKVDLQTLLKFYTQTGASLLSGEEGEPANTNDLQISNLRVGEVIYDNYSVENAIVSLDQKIDGYDVHVDSAALKGKLHYFGDQQPAQIKLEYIDLTALNHQQTFQIKPGSVDPTKVPSFDFFVKDLRNGKQNYGSWSFRSRHKQIGNKDVLFVDQLKGRFKHVEVSSKDGQGARLIWDQQKGSSFQGRLVSDDPSKVLVGLGYEPILDAEKVEIDANVRWPGSPLSFNLVASSGDWDLSFKKGSFLQTPPGATNTLKLLGFVNLAKVLRRLQLDFSDLAAQGLAFDSVSGSFSNKRGIFQATRPIVVKGTSSEIKITGSLNARLKTVDANMAVTIPIGSNLPWLAVFAAGLPAAAGVFIASKLMRKTVNQFTSLVYRVEGDWNKPNIKFKHLFDVGDQVDIFTAAVDDQKKPEKVIIEGLLDCGKKEDPEFEVSLEIHETDSCA